MNQSNNLKFVYILFAFLFAFLMFSCAPTLRDIRDEPESRGSEPKIVFTNIIPSGTFEVVTESEMHQKSKTKALGITGSQTEKNREVNESIVTVSEPDPLGRTTLSFKTNRLFKETKNPKLQLTKLIDTDKHHTIPIGIEGDIIKSFLRDNIEACFDKNWQVINLIWPDDMWEKIMAKYPDKSSNISEIKTQCDMSLTKMLCLSIKNVPAEAIGINAVWYMEDEIPLPFFGNLKAKFKNKLTELEKTDKGKIAIITQLGTLASNAVSGKRIGNTYIRCEYVQLEFKGYSKVEVDTGVVSLNYLDIKGRFSATATSGILKIDR